MSRTQPPSPVTWHERQHFLNVSASIKGLKLWCCLQKLLPLFNDLAVSTTLSSTLSANWYIDEKLPPAMKTAIDVWASDNGYCDVWFKNVGLLQLRSWSGDPESIGKPFITIPCIAVNRLEEGLPGPFSVRLLEWLPQTGQQWQEYAKAARKAFDLCLKQYRQQSLSYCPSLANLHGYNHYVAVAEYQEGTGAGRIDEATWKQITRTAKRIGLTLRARHQTSRPGVQTKASSYGIKRT